MDNNSELVSKLNIKHTKIQSCILSAEDLKKLFKVLKKKAAEAADKEIEQLPPQPPNKTPQEVEKFKKYIKNILLKLTAQFIGTKGEIITGSAESMFDKNNIPKDLQAVTFQHSYFYNSVMKKLPSNYLKIHIDFSKPSVLDFSTPPYKATRNNSYIEVSGNDETWVDGVYQAILSFFGDRKIKRNWIHLKYIYDLFLYLLIMPFTFWSLFRIDSYLGFISSKISPILHIAISVYIFIVILSIYRVVFNYARWVFPLIEFKSKDSRMAKHRRVLYSIFIAIGIPFLCDLLKFIFKR